MPLCRIWYCEMVWYLAKTAFQAAVESGGRVDVYKRQK